MTERSEHENQFGKGDFISQEIERKIEESAVTPDKIKIALQEIGFKYDGRSWERVSPEDARLAPQLLVTAAPSGKLCVAAFDRSVLVDSNSRWNEEVGNKGEDVFSSAQSFTFLVPMSEASLEERDAYRNLIETAQKLSAFRFQNSDRLQKGFKLQAKSTKKEEDFFGEDKLSAEDMEALKLVEQEKILVDQARIAQAAIAPQSSARRRAAWAKEQTE